MKKGIRTLFLLMSCVFTLMIAAAAVFFLLNKFDVLNMRFESDTFDVINTVPLAAVYLYGIVSAFYKTGSLKQTFIVGIIMYLYGLGHMEKWVPMSMMLMSCFCYEMAFFELGNGGGAGFSFWETFLLPVICIMIIADLIATAKFSKKNVQMKV